MKRLLIIMLLSGPAIAESPTWYPGLLGDVYRAACEGPLGGTYVMSEPNFYQAWACEGINWCELRPETFGCTRPPSIPVPGKP